MRNQSRWVAVAGLCLVTALLAGTPGLAQGQSIPRPPMAPRPASSGRFEIVNETPMPQGSQAKHLERSVASGGRRVSVVGNASNIQVTAVAGDEIRVIVDLEYWSNNEDWMTAVDREFGIEIDETSREVEISFTDVSKLGEEGWVSRMLGRRRMSFEMEVTLEVPATTPLSIDNRYGDVTVDTVGGPVFVSNNSGDVEVIGVEGEAEIENRYGDVIASQVNGPLTIAATSGEVSVENVTGTADISNQYGPVEVEGVGGRLDVRATSCAVSVTDAQDEVTIRTSYDGVVLNSIAGPVDVDLSSGNVEIRSVRSDVRLKTSYGSIDIIDVEGDLVMRASSVEGEIREVGGDLDLESSYGDLLIDTVGGTATVTNTSGGVTLSSAGGDTEIQLSYAAARVNGVNGSLRIIGTSAAVQASDITGPVDVETSYDGVRLSEIGGAVTVRNQSGRVEVSGLTGAALNSTHTVETSYADIEFVWPSSAGAPAYRLEASYGQITSDFPGTTQERGSRVYRESDPSATAAATLDLKTQSGNITLRQR